MISNIITLFILRVIRQICFNLEMLSYKFKTNNTSSINEYNVNSSNKPIIFGLFYKLGNYLSSAAIS